MFLDNLVFHFNPNQFDEMLEKLRKITHSFRLSWELNQMDGSPLWKRHFSILASHPIQMYISLFHSFGDDASIRCFPFQVHWFNFINSPLHYIEEDEHFQLDFTLKLLENIEIKRWHFELTLIIGRSQPIFEAIVKPLEEKGWRIVQLQPDPEKILYRDKFSLWHLLHPSRKIFIKGYVTNNFYKYPPCFENMTKVELVLPHMTEPTETFSNILSTAQDIRAKLLMYKYTEIIKETRQIIWAKAFNNPMIYSWFNNSSSLNLAWNMFKFSQQEYEIQPFPNIYLKQEETLKILKEFLKQLKGE